MDRGREMPLRRDWAGWLSAQHGSVARHDRPAEGTDTVPFRHDLLERLVEILPGGSFAASSSGEKGDASGASDVSSPSVSIARNSRRGSKRRA
jgi:hypothetical protein